MNVKVLVSLCLVVMLQACSTSYVTYHCQADKEFDVAYTKNHESAVIRVDNQEYTLMQVPAGSGVKYVPTGEEKTKVNPLVLHTKGEHARLEVGSEVYKGCRI